MSISTHVFRIDARLPDRPSLKEAGALTWQYVGQATYSFEPEFIGPRMVMHKDEQPERLVDQLLGQRRFTADGEVWEVVHVDESKLDPNAVERADALRAAWSPSSQDADAEPVFWYPMSWTHEDCDSESGNDVHVWHSESRNPKTSDFTARQRTAAKLTITGVGGCSGVFLSSTFVLTAAHCIADGNGNAFATNLITVENVDGTSRGAFDVFPANNYNTGPLDLDVEDDWGLVQLSPAMPNVELQDPWTGSDSVFMNIGSDVHSLGYPGHRLSSSLNCLTNSALLHAPNNDATSTTSKRVRLRGDVGKGQSGGPFYFCPQGADDVCGHGEPAEFIGIFAAWSGGTTNRGIGPKASAFEGAAHSILVSNGVSNPW